MRTIYQITIYTIVCSSGFIRFSYKVMQSKYYIINLIIKINNYH